MKPVNIDKNGGVVQITVQDEKYPQSITGIIWRYNKDKTPDGKIGSFNSEINMIPIGQPEDCVDKLLLVDGIIVHQNDDPPTPYQVLVRVHQNQKEIFKMVPEDNGSGQLGKSNIQFTLRLQLVVS